MPRTTHTIQKVERKDRSSYFQASIGGKKHYLGTDRVEAKRRLAALVNDNARPVPLGSTETIGGLVRAYLQQNPKMPERYVLVWLRFAGTEDLENIRPDHLTAYHQYLRKAKYRWQLSGGKPGPWKPYSAKTIRHYVSAAMTILTWAYQNERIGFMPVRPKTAKPVSTPRDMPLQAIADLLESLRPAMRAIVGFIFHTGCRPSEACRLRWEWFRPNDGGRGSFRMPLETHKTGEKTGLDKTIYLTPEARRIIDGLHRPRPFVFVNMHGRPFTSDAIQSATSRRGVKNPYRLRHTYATNALASGVPIHIVSKLLGHSSIVTTEKYASTLVRQASDAASALSLQLPAPSGDGERRKPLASRRKKQGRRSHG